LRGFNVEGIIRILERGGETDKQISRDATAERFERGRRKKFLINQGDSGVYTSATRQMSRHSIGRRISTNAPERDSPLKGKEEKTLSSEGRKASYPEKSVPSVGGKKKRFKPSGHPAQV